MCYGQDCQFDEQLVLQYVSQEEMHGTTGMLPIVHSVFFLTPDACLPGLTCAYLVSLAHEAASHSTVSQRANSLIGRQETLQKRHKSKVCT